MIACGTIENSFQGKWNFCREKKFMFISICFVWTLKEKNLQCVREIEGGKVFSIFIFHLLKKNLETKLYAFPKIRKTIFYWILAYATNHPFRVIPTFETGGRWHQRGSMNILHDLRGYACVYVPHNKLTCLTWVMF